MTPTIRQATVEDLPWLRAFFVELHAEQQAKNPIPYPTVGPADADAFTLSMFRALDTPTVCLAVAVDTEPVGFLAGEIMEREIGSPRKFGHAHYLYVRPAYRKHGTAAALMGYTAAWGIERNIPVVECYGLVGDDGWARRGFKPLLTRYYLELPTVVGQSVEVITGEQPEKRQTVTAPIPTSKTRRKKRKKGRMNGVAIDEVRHATR